MSDENVIPLRRDPQGNDLTTAHNNAATESPSPSFQPPKPSVPVRISYSIQSAGFSKAPPVTTTQPQTVPANDPRLDAFKRIIGGMLYLERYDALEKLLSDPTMDSLRHMPMADSKQSALDHLLNSEFYIHPGQTSSTTHSTPNSHHAFLINELCSKLNDVPNETADKMQMHIRNVIRILLNMDEINCARESRYRQEKKPFHYIATSGNLEFVQFFIARRPDLIPEPHSEDGKDIIATLKSDYVARKSAAQKPEATARANDIVTMISEATTQRNLENGDFNRISPEQYIARLMGEFPTAIDPKLLTAPQEQKAIPAPKGGRKPRQNKGLEPQ